jgi:hypothetical protein
LQAAWDGAGSTGEKLKAIAVGSLLCASLHRPSSWQACPTTRKSQLFLHECFFLIFHLKVPLELLEVIIVML